MTAAIRVPLPEEAADIGRVHAQVWRETYAGIASDEWVAGISDQERISTWKRILGEPNAAEQWIAEVDGRVVGFAASGPARELAPVRVLELWSLYVLNDHQGSGIGTALLDAAIGTRSASLWVATGNTSAQAFYRARGFTADGRTSVIDTMDYIPELRMVR